MHFILVLITAVLIATLPAQADPLSGTATVIDGKSIEVAGTRLQLFGIDRQLAICTAGGFDVARILVHTGWALADREQSNRYVVNENKAKAAKRGLWKGTFTPPKQWRDQHEQTKNK